MPATEPAWLTLARADIGVREAPGAKNDPRVLEYYRDAGHPEIKHDAVAWCAAFACAQLERADTPSPKNLAARSFLQWGKALDGPRVGAICVVTRGDPSSWTGHVFFVTRWTATHVYGIGGNQSDAVSEAGHPLETVLGYRWPVTLANSRTAQAAGVSAGAGAVNIATRATEAAMPAADTVARIAEAGETGQALAVSLQGLASALPVLGLIAGVVSVIAAGVVLWARVDDLLSKGR